MKKRKLTRRDFLKLAGVGAAVVVPATLGVGVYQSARGEDPPRLSPYVELSHTANLDGSVPLLLIVDKESANPFGMYYAEILRAEGLNCFHTTDLSALKPDTLANYSVAILAETALNTLQAEMFEAYVARGGSLVTMRPDDRLNPIFGVEGSGKIFPSGYIKTVPNHPASKGISSFTLQFHSDANEYALAGAQVVAWLYSERDVASKYPAITINSFGDGLSSCWAFDLAKSIVFTRQGNPEFSNQERDEHPYIRATDMFVDWIDLERIAIPQADEHQRLFVKVLHELSKYKKPLLRLWYFPKDVVSLLVATGDAHPMSGADTIDGVLKRVEQRRGHMSIYYSSTLHDDFYRFAQKGRFLASKLPVIGDQLISRYKTPTPDQVANWRDRGHEFTVHPHVGVDICGGFGVDSFVPFDSIEDGWQTYWRQFTGLGYGPVSPTVRTHCVLWQGWAETARLQASYGIEMNFDYYHVGPALRKRNGDWVYGHFTGSGLPMRFIDEQGRVLTIYQQLTQFADEHFFSFPEIGWVDVGDYTADAALDISKGLIQFGLDNDFPAAYGFQFHPDPFAYGGSLANVAGRWLDENLDYAVEKGIPIWSSQDWLEFTQTRQCMTFLSFIWNDESCSLDVSVEVARTQHAGVDRDLVFMIPAEHGALKLTSIKLDNVICNLCEMVVIGISYRCISIPVGVHRIVAFYL